MTASSVDTAWSPSALRPVTTTDAWKLAGLILLLIDHYGLFFDEDQDWWRVVGRTAAPIFFFFIGFARTRDVPWTWIALGLLLTLLDYLVSDTLEEVEINILLNFALVRLALTFIETRIAHHSWRVLAFATVCAAAIPVTSWLEYGSEGLLWALVGLAHRIWLTEDTTRAWWTRNLAAVAAVVGYTAYEIFDFELELWPAAVLAVLIAALTLLLLGFRRADLKYRLPRFLAAILTFSGQRSLEIYAATLAIMQVMSVAIAGD